MEIEEKKSILWINILSVVIPLVVAILLNPRFPKVENLGNWTKMLPHMIGAINSITSILLIYGFYLIKNKQIEKHRKVMTLAFGLGAVFLVCYILYHLTNPSTSFGGQGFIKYFYLFILISHIVLSLVVLPLVLRAYFFAWTKQFQKHRKLVKFAYPIWLYVSITGVIAYLMIRPFYN